MVWNAVLQVGIFSVLVTVISVPLGLYMAREIVAAHDGELRVTSPVGSGTTFTITLLLVGDATDRAALLRAARDSLRL